MTKQRISQKMFNKALGPAVFITSTIWGAVFIDGIIVCKYLGTDEIAAVGLAYPIILCVQLFGGCISNGLQIFCSEKIGTGQTNKVKDVFAQMYTVAFLISVLLFLFIIGFSNQLAVFLGASKDVPGLKESTAAYIRGYAIGIPGVILNLLFRTGMQLSEDRGKLKIASIALFASDVVLDLASVKLGYGTFGIGLASSLSYYISLIIFLISISKGKTMISLSFRKIDFHYVFLIVTYGSEILLRRGINIIKPLILNRLILYFGGMTALSAIFIQNNITSIINIPTNAITMALSIVVGLFYGENNEKEIKEVNTYSKKCVWVITGIIAAFLLIFSKKIAGFYTTGDSDLQKLLTFAVCCIAIQLPFNSLNFLRLSYLQAIMQTKKALLYTFVFNFVLVILSVFIFSSIWGASGVFVGFIASDILMLFVSRLCYIISKKEYTALPDSFYLDSKNSIFMEINNVNDCVLASQKAFNFCNEHQADLSKTHRIALCIEEWCENIIEHGYNPTSDANINIQNPITLFLKISKQNIVVYIKDVSPAFDILKHMEYINQTNQNDITKNIGIKLIQHSAKEIKYNRVLDTNIIIFTI